MADDELRALRFRQEIAFSELLQLGFPAGDEARARIMDTVRWLFAHSSPEDEDQWDAEIDREKCELTMSRREVSIRFDIEGYCEVTFASQPCADELLELYYKLKQINTEDVPPSWPILVWNVPGVHNGLHDPAKLPPEVIREVLKNGWAEPKTS